MTADATILSEPTEWMSLPMEQYATDDVGAPMATLNSGLANRLLNRSPLHTWTGHPKLNPAWKPVENEAFDIGAAVHDMVIEGAHRYEVLDFPDWRTNASKEARQAARDAGKRPLLRHQADAVAPMADAVWNVLRASPDLEALGELDFERTYVWEEEAGGRNAWLRCRPDWVTLDRKVALSFKTTSSSAEPEAFARTIMNFGYDLQAAFECRGIEAVLGVKVEHYIWVVQETTAPFAVSLVGMSNQMREYGQTRMDAAVLKWAECMATGEWPGYPLRIAYIDPPAWAMREMEMEA